MLCIHARRVGSQRQKVTLVTRAVYQCIDYRGPTAELDVTTLSCAGTLNTAHPKLHRIKIPMRDMHVRHNKKFPGVTL
ncbi:hypothetical protein ARMGADRAFT_1079694 [Armillaria gallica]|uniref:Uncharacterized protein n=1 Tax=Armillaria gallica TaxID=47427 RepID=A0A2H3DR71_ARMGA|nr:hypothetical protein ARMGADRAFT_1079694 [Armillaria gallica]